MHSKIVKLTLAQWRMLGRLVRGENLPTTRYHGRTVHALERKGCVARHHHHYWTSTPFGKAVHAVGGYSARLLDQPS